MVVKLNALTRKVALPRIGTALSEGWTKIKGGGPLAEQGLARRRQLKSTQIAFFCNWRLNNNLVLAKESTSPPELFVYHRLKSVRQLNAETASILFDSVLLMELGGGIAILAIKNIVKTG